MAEKTKKIKKDHLGVLLENMDSKIDLILESHSALNKRIGDNHEEFREFCEENNHKFKIIIGKFSEMDRRFDGIDANLKVALEYLFRIDEEIQDIKKEITELKDAIKGKAEKEKVLQMEKRLEMLEKEFMLYKKRALANRS
jgi:chromosome segregation ATPase